MAFNGSGVFNRIYNWVTDAANSVPITASRMDTEDTGFASGLSNCITKDGQQIITADIPWAGFKLTGLGDAAGAQDAVNLRTAQTLIQSGVYGVAGGTANAITASVSSFAYTAGAVINLKLSATNTSTTVNLNVNSLGNKLVLDAAGASIAVSALLASSICSFIYDGTSFRMITPVASSGTFTGTLVGSTTSPTKTIQWARTGNLVTLTSGLVWSTATSNATTMSITGLPAALSPANTSAMVNCFENSFTDNGSLITVAAGKFVDGFISAGTTAITFRLNGSITGWTNTGSKFPGTFSTTFSLA